MGSAQRAQRPCTSKRPVSVAGRQLIRASSLPPLLQALFDLEATNNELKSDLRDLYINGAQEVDVQNGRTAIVIHVSHSHFSLVSDLKPPGSQHPHIQW